MRVGKRICGALVLLGLAYGPSAAQERAPVPKTATPGIAATVNGQPIPESAVQRALKRVPPDKHAEARTEFLNHFVENLLIEQHLLQLRIDVAKADVDKAVNQTREELKKAGKAGLTFEKWLEEMLLTEDELRTHITADLRWDRYVTAQATEKVLRDFFTRYPEMFNGSMVRARHILLTPAAGDTQAAQKAKVELGLVKQKIEQQVAEGLAKVPAGADILTREKVRSQMIEEAFATAAREKSACPSKEQGGDLGFFPRAGSMVEPFAQAAFALKAHQMSDLVATQFGFHLILATERKLGKETKFEEVKDAVREVYADRLRAALCDQLRPTAKIVIQPAPKS